MQVFKRMSAKKISTLGGLTQEVSGTQDVSGYGFIDVCTCALSVLYRSAASLFKGSSGLGS